jgi:hypothetical protein
MFVIIEMQCLLIFRLQTLIEQIQMNVVTPTPITKNKLQMYFLFLTQYVYVPDYPRFSIIRALSSPPLPIVNDSTLYVK